MSAPLGGAVTAWSYIWRITPIHRRESDGSLGEDMPPPLPAGVSREEIQVPETGSGPLLHRTYTGILRDAEFGPAELIGRLSTDLNRVAPQALARFHKSVGDDSSLRVSDEFVVRMLAPWDGPVRAVDVTPTSFRFATLAGHLEAGQIEWRAFERDGRVVFQVDSWARSGDRFAALLHDRLPMAKEVQLHMWTSVIERVARESGGRLTGGVDVETRRVDAEVFAR